jgi:hypothetical protein
MQNQIRSGGLAATFAATVLTSAFLLFQVQPLISKFILPWFGGSPAVWTTCMCFFQTLLFGGYAYAHLSQRLFKPSLQAWFHVGLLAMAAGLLPILPDAGWKPTSAEDPTWRIVGLLTMTVGIPYFVLSATGPLLQAWFSRAYPRRSPYRLYALSNVGSLAALLTYPFYFEPAMNVGQQAQYWSAGFLLFGLLCGYAALRTWWINGAAPTGNAAQAPLDSAEDAAPKALARLLWVVLPAFASLILLATTNHVCQNVAVIPFLWVLPLSLYLLSFIISFDHPRWYVRRWFAISTAALAILVAGWPLWNFELNFVYELGLYFATLFGICMLCHGELVRLRPPPSHLTMFYLLISAGGALGGIFVSLVAPQVFTTFFEWKIGLVGTFALAATLAVFDFRRRWAGAQICATGATFSPWNQTANFSNPGMRPAVSVCLALGGLFFVVDSQRDSRRAPLAEARNFYGAVSVLERAPNDPEERDFCMFHGGIIHGVQFAKPEKRRQATTYYSPESGVGRAIEFYAERPRMHVGVVGLGVGTLAAYPRAGQRMRCYEINPEVVRMAKSYFTFLKDCRGELEIVLGDARLSLEQEPSQQFDLLVLDAFSGDAVPSHLLTREAMEIYLRHLAPGGTIAVHITNTYLDLAPVVRGLAAEFAFKRARIETPYDPVRQLYRADWMLLTRNDQLLAEVAPYGIAGEPRQMHRLLWTDSHSNLFHILK